MAYTNLQWPQMRGIVYVYLRAQERGLGGPLIGPGRHYDSHPAATVKQDNQFGTVHKHASYIG